MLFRSTFRTIKKSLGRYLAILSIIALGVGFFAGLRVTEKAMIKTADEYICDLGLYDFRLISTLGLTDDDVSAFGSLDGVLGAYGAKTSDLIYINPQGSDSVAHVHAIISDLRGFDIVSGRLPENPDECLLDSLFSGEEAVGSVLKLSPNNPDSIFDTFSFDEFKVVGVVNSANYLNFERGTTSLAGGSASSYIYVPMEAFSTDYYTEVYLTIPRSGEIYSDEYNKAVDLIRESVEKLLEGRADIRYDKLYNDALIKITDAKSELDEKSAELDNAKTELNDGIETFNKEKADAEKKLSDAKDELDSAKAELSDGWEEYLSKSKDPINNIPEIRDMIIEAENKLAEGEKEYEAGLSEYNNALEEAKKQFAEAEKKLKDGEEELVKGKEEYQKLKLETEQKLEDARIKLENGKKELDDGKEKLMLFYNDPFGQYPEIVDEIKKSEQQLSDGEKEYEEGVEQYNNAVNEANEAFSEAEEKLEEAKKKLDDGKAQLEMIISLEKRAISEIEKRLSAASEQLEIRRSELEAEKNRPDADDPAVKAKITIKEAELKRLEDIYSATFQIYERAVSAADNRIAELKKEISDGEAEYNAALETYESEKENALSQLEDARIKLEKARKELDEGWEKLERVKRDPIGEIPELKAICEQSQKELEDGEREYEEGLERYNSGLKEALEGFKEAEKKLEAAEKELEEGWNTYYSEKESAERELENARQKLEDAKAELESGKASLERIKADPIGELPELEKMLGEAELKLKDGESEYEKGVSEYEDAVITVEKELADAEKELEEAKDKIAEGEEKIAEAQKEIDEGFEELGSFKPGSVFALDRLSNVGYASLKNDTAIVSGVAKVFPLFFFLVAALVCITTITRMVSEQRTENGVLKALGYSRLAIASRYLIYAGSASAMGCVLGFLLGSWLLPKALWQVYLIMYTIDLPIAFVLDWNLFAVCTSMYLVCALGAAWLVCNKDLKENAASLIRPKAPTAGKRTLIERVGFIWNRLKFLHKVSIRNILRYKKRMFMMIVGIGGCTALLLTGLGIRDSIQPIIDYQFDEITLYDAGITFLEPLDDDGEKDFSGYASKVCEGIAYIHTETSDLICGNVTEQVNLIVSESGLDGFVSLHKGSEKIEYPKKGEVVIDYRLSKEYGITVGDTVTLRNTDFETVTVTVSGVFDNYIYDFCLISSDTYSDSLGREPDINTAYVNFKDGVDIHSAGAELLNNERVAIVSINDDMRSRVGSMLSSLDYIVLIVLVCAGALAFIVLYNLTNITITERTREIATLKVLGFYRNEQNSYVFRENIILTAISAVCGIPMGIALLEYVMSKIKISSMYFGCRINLSSYILAIAITFVFTVVVDLALTSKTAKINMAEAMKAIE